MRHDSTRSDGLYCDTSIGWTVSRTAQIQDLRLIGEAEAQAAHEKHQKQVDDLTVSGPDCSNFVRRNLM